jgi:hypothetical protein
VPLELRTNTSRDAPEPATSGTEVDEAYDTIIAAEAEPSKTHTANTVRAKVLSMERIDDEPVKTTGATSVMKLRAQSIL